MNTKDITNAELLSEAMASMLDIGACYEGLEQERADSDVIRVELLRRLNEADALRKENAKLRYALAMLLPLKQDGSVSICQMQRQFHLGYFAASTIAEAVNASTARHAKGGQP